MDISLFYEEKGEGFPLILLHGNGENGRYFEHQMKYFSRFFRVIAVDTRGHGNTPRGNAPFTIAQFADDLNDFMEVHQIEQAHILGFSDGANIAMKFAFKYPHRIVKLILDGGNLNGWGVHMWVQLPIEISYRLERLRAKKSAAARKKMELLGLMVKDPNIKFSQLKEIQNSTLVIAGTRDVIKTSHTKKIARNIPNAKLVIIKGDHFIAEKEYKRFNKVVEDFLRH